MLLSFYLMCIKMLTFVFYIVLYCIAKSKAYKACLVGISCVISAFSCVCVINAMDDGNCSPG